MIPIQATAPLLQAGAAATAAATAVGSSFASLLRNATSGPAGKPAEATPADKASATPDANAPGPGGAGLDLAEIRGRTNSLIRTFHSQFLQLLAAHGIDTSMGVDLELDAFGAVRVGGLHPDDQEIERLIASHPGLTETFQQIAANAGLLRAAEHAGSLSGPSGLPASPGVANAPGGEGTFRLSIEGGTVRTSFGSGAA